MTVKRLTIVSQDEPRETVRDAEIRYFTDLAAYTSLTDDTDPDSVSEGEEQDNTDDKDEAFSDAEA